MELKDFVCVVKNKTNNQTNLTIKKTKLKDMDITEEELLALKINKSSLNTQ
jgi:hypothetical protein